MVNIISSATPTVEDIIELIDSGVAEFMNQKLCDSEKVTNVLLDIRNLVSLNSNQESQI
jgi:hypothetical protein